MVGTKSGDIYELLLPQYSEEDFYADAPVTKHTLVDIINIAYYFKNANTLSQQQIGNQKG